MTTYTRPYSKNGCCTDRRSRDRAAAEGRSTSGYSHACVEQTCMELPEGQSCSMCVHESRCVQMFGAKPENTHCGFFPRRFRLKVTA